MIKKGTGLAVSFYPTGFAMGGDTSHVSIRILSDGSAEVFFGTTDCGQGLATVLCQVAAEELGIPVDMVRSFNLDSDLAPYSAGAVASRGAYSDSIAVSMAAKDVKKILTECVAEQLDVEPEKIVMDNMAFYVSDNNKKSVSYQDAVWFAIHQQGRNLLGRGEYIGEVSIPDPETGACIPFRTLAWSASVADVEVDTDTGIVTVKKVVSAYDVGRALNPQIVKSQINGGTVMGMGAAIMEELYPFYPEMTWQARSFGDYCIPNTTDLPEMETIILECNSTDNEYGAKGVGEMTPNVVCPAILNAVHNAIGIRFTSVPLSPSKVLAALEAQTANV